MLYRAEQCLWALAGVLILASVGWGLGGFLGQQARLDLFDAVAAAAPAGGEPLALGQPDRSDWSAARVSKYFALQPTRAAAPEAVLRIPALDIEAEIFGDTGNRSLDLGVGHIAGTALPGEAGNIGIAGHRDGYFRRLKDVRPGQRIRILTQRGSWDYEVQRTRVVDPADVDVLDERGEPMLTLVTCYPFYFVGNAPQRFIVHARMVSPTAPQTKRS
jgi:sortase A